MEFELIYENETATFKMPDFEDIRECFNNQFNFNNIAIANKMLLEKLYLSGDKIFFENEDYLLDLTEELSNLFEDVLKVTTSYQDENDKINIFFSDDTNVLLKKPGFKVNRMLIKAKQESNFNYLDFLKVQMFEHVQDVNLLIKSPEKILLTSLHFGALINLKKIELKKKLKI